MENATKALIIAGGIFFALLILSLIIYVATAISGMADEQDKNTLAKQIATFNKGYEAYNKSRMYGTDIITVVNKANDNNQKDQYQVTITVYDTNGNKISKNFDGLKTQIFECTDVQYNEETGRIESMTFKQI
ncbi:MAG: hypothetical protein Q4G09_01160 [Clostridia bacterium]|nr:hypothetical protein [Clostridia bacterium]